MNFDQKSAFFAILIIYIQLDGYMGYQNNTLGEANYLRISKHRGQKNMDLLNPSSFEEKSTKWILLILVFLDLSIDNWGFFNRLEKDSF